MRDGHEDGAHRLAILLSRSGDAGNGDPNIGTEHLPGALSHRNGGGRRDNRTLRNSENIEFHLGRVAHYPTAEPRRGTRNRDAARCDHPAGHRFRQTEGPPPPAQRITDNGFHRVVIDSKDEVAEEPANFNFLGIKKERSFLGGWRFGREADFDALDAAG